MWFHIIKNNYKKFLECYTWIVRTIVGKGYYLIDYRKTLNYIMNSKNTLIISFKYNTSSKSVYYSYAYNYLHLYIFRLLCIPSGCELKLDRFTLDREINLYHRRKTYRTKVKIRSIQYPNTWNKNVPNNVISEMIIKIVWIKVE